MNSRERILSTIPHQEPDHVPIDMGATPSSGIPAIAYGRLKQNLGIHTGNNRVYDVVQQLAQPEEEILKRFHIDVVDLGRTFDVSDTDWYYVKLFDGSDAQYAAWFDPEATTEGGWRAIAPDGTEIATQLTPSATTTPLNKNRWFQHGPSLGNLHDVLPPMGMETGRQNEVA